MPWYGFIAYERCQTGVKGLVEADSLEEAKAKIDAGDVYDCEHDFDGPGGPGYDLIGIWEYEEYPNEFEDTEENNGLET